MKSIRHLAAAAVVLAIAAAAFMAWTDKPLAPSVPYTLLDGSRHSTEQLRGQVVLVNFWATSCVTCIKEMPALIATQQKFESRGYRTLAVAMSYDPPAYVVNFVETRKLPFLVAMDHDGSIARSFGDVQLTPTSVLINKRGEVVKRYLGEPDFDELHALVDKLLSES
jgi:peroxiredoxin